MMAMSMLLKSWAIPPASRPMASIFCAWRSCCSSVAFSVMSKNATTAPATTPSSTTGWDQYSTRMLFPSLRQKTSSSTCVSRPSR